MTSNFDKTSLRTILRGKLGGASPLGLLIFATLTAGCGGGDDQGNGASGSAGVGGTTSSGGSAGSGAGDAGTAGGNTQDSGPLACTSSNPSVEMVSVPAGPFLMGCNDAVDHDCNPIEKPGHTVTLKAFEIDKLEVTQDQYAACVAAGACSAPSCAWDCSQTNYPAGCINWNQAKAFCSWSSKRLPTEAEWEKAARGADGMKYPWGNDEPTCEVVNMAGCKGASSAAGAYPAGASPYGALDMAGNMVEMLNDFYDDQYYASQPTTDPTGPAAGNRFVGRGGGWKSEPTWQRASVRDWYDPKDAGKSLGFRCAR